MRYIDRIIMAWGKQGNRTLAKRLRQGVRLRMQNILEYMIENGDEKTIQEMGSIMPRGTHFIANGTCRIRNSLAAYAQSVV